MTFFGEPLGFYLIGVPLLFVVVAFGFMICAVALFLIVAVVGASLSAALEFLVFLWACFKEGER